MGVTVSRQRFWRVVLGCALLAPPLAAVAGPWAENAQARVRLVSRFAVAVPGGDAGLGLEFRMAPGWHVYWLNPGDAGYPPKLTLAAG
ncbi:MAG: hypothetical protein NDJ75_03865, partial [Thermoanaerobaculia bacterium]|nr:hypothetical protein [Thermoanaerobaculia bacterium]